MEPPILLPGELVAGRYTVGPLVGAGVFATVHRALDTETGELVALKLLRPRAADNDELIERLRREAECYRALAHPSTVGLRHLGRHKPATAKLPLPYLVVDLIRGLTLEALLVERGALGGGESAKLMARVLDLLQHSHMMGLLHRDLKPTNLLVEAPEARWVPPLDEGEPHGRLGVPPPSDPLWADTRPLQVKVIDFGLAKFLEFNNRRVTRLTQRGVVAGTSYYLSPEQVVQAKDIDHRADLYGAAMVLHVLLTGRPCFDGDNVMKIAFMHLKAERPPLPEPWTHHPVAAVFARAADRDKAKRYGSAAEMAWALRAAFDPELAASEPPPFDLPPPPRKRRFFERLFDF